MCARTDPFTIGQCDSVQIVRFSILELVLVSNIREIVFHCLTRRLCSGAWLLQLSKELPASTKLYGCDISSSNFPKAHPGNVEFRVASVTSMPQDWSGKFDFVNQRFLAAGLPGSDWYPAMSELFRVLRPGGHIELIDLDFLATVNAGPHSTRFLGLASELFAKRGLLFDCARRLRGFAEAAGFVDVKADKQYFPVGKAWGRIGQLGTSNAVGVFAGMGSFMKATGIVASNEEISCLIDDIVQEWDNSDIGMRFVAYVVCARKPEEVS